MSLYFHQKYFLHLLITAILMMTLSAQAREKVTKHDGHINLEELDAYILKSMKLGNVPGLSIAIVKDGRTTLTKGYGTRELGKKLPVDEKTLFQAVSLTKDFTVTALAMLEDEGKMTWDDQLVGIIPDFETSDEFLTRNVTIFDVLRGRDGTAFDFLSYSLFPNRSEAEQFSLLKHAPVSGGFRGDSKSSGGSSVEMQLSLGQLIPVLTGRSWEGFIKDRLFKPLSMQDSITGSHRFGQNRNIAKGHYVPTGHRYADLNEFTKNLQVLPLKHMARDNLRSIYGAYTSARDMARWLQFQLDSGRVGNKQLVSEKNMALIRADHGIRPTVLPSMLSVKDNLGMKVLLGTSGLGDTGSFFHSSGFKIHYLRSDSWGMESSAFFIPELDLGIAILTNAGHMYIAMSLETWIVDRFIGAEKIDWVGKYISSDLMRAHNNVEKKFHVEVNKLRKSTDSTKKMSMPLASYTGIYRNPFLGDIILQQEGQDIAFTIGNHKGVLKHSKQYTFYPEVFEPIYGSMMFSGAIEFNFDSVGNIESLTLARRPLGQPDHIFKKTP